MDNRAIKIVNIDNIIQNIYQIKRHINGKKFMLVIKANAYGHGAVEIGLCVESFVDYFGVAIIEEGIKLRQAGIKKPILILGNVCESQLNIAIQYNLEITVFSPNKVKEVLRYNQLTGNKLRVHIAFDTGMTRLGLDEKQLDSTKLLKNNCCDIVGAFSHYAYADNYQDSFTMEQTQRLDSMLDYVQLPSDVQIHCCNSAGVFNSNSKHYDMVRVGIMAYGLYPSYDLKSLPCLQSAMTIKSSIVQIKTINKNTSVGYGRAFFAQRTTKVGTIPIGYADGLSRSWSGKNVLIGGQKVQLIGNICMDQCMVDITNIVDAKVGDEVVIIGEQGKEVITFEEVAKQIGTINYELVCNFDKRITTKYILNNKEYNYKN